MGGSPVTGALAAGEVWSIVLPYETPPLTENQRMHWSARRKLVARVRERASWEARSRRIPPLGRCRVNLEWHVATNHRRDADNVVPTLKALCDGLVDAGVVPDDTPDLMEKTMPAIVRLPTGRTKADQFLLLRITDIS